MNTKLLQTALVFSVVSCFSAQAAVIPADGEIHTNCSAVTLNYVGTPADNSLQQNYNATSCKGMAGNDPDYSYNIGLFGDGLLNGERLNGKDPLFTSYEFADWVDVNGDGIDDKPGWIGLARVEGPGNISYNTVAGVNLHPLFDNNSLGNVFDLTFSYANGGNLSGDWRLQVNAAALLAAKALLGNSYFDHLNIVLKSGTTGFMSYNFDFNKIFDHHNDEYDTELSLLSNYTLGGSWATTDLLSKKGEQQGLSHATFAAHDPLTTDVVSAPTTVGLFGLSLLGLVASRRRRQ